MSNAAPYWGNLQGAKGGQRARRASDDFSAADRRQSLDAAAQPLARSNRASTQTTNTDAPTESTHSPFASPTASSFQGAGLAPRPPTLPYGAKDYPPELLEKRRRRKSASREEDYEQPSGAPPPAAPEVPRAPPVSYKYPSGNGGLPYTYSGPGPAYRPSPYSPGAGIMDREEFYKAPTPEGGETHPVLDRARQTLDARRNGTDPTANRRARAAEAAAAGHQRSSSGSEHVLHHRKAALPGQPPRSKFADDRSPLQRLEQNLTKEEKRARAEAAEQAAREKTGGDRGAQPEGGKAATQQVRFSGPPVPPKEALEPSPMPVRTRQPAPTSAAPPSQGPLSQNPPEGGRRVTGPEQARSSRAQVPDSRIPVPVDDSGIPKRNLSFKERAAKGDLKIPNGIEPDPLTSSPITPPVASPTGGLSRSGSNKLKKNPPGDPWFNKRTEAEQRYPVIQTPNGPFIQTPNGPVPIPQKPRRGPSTRKPEIAEPSAVPPAPAAAPLAGPGSVRNRAPAPADAYMASGARGPGPDDAYDDDDYDDDDLLGPSPAPKKLTKSPSQRKADQILGRNSAPHPPAQHARQRSPVGQSPASRTAPALAATGAGLAAGAVAASSAHAHAAARRDARNDSDTSDDEDHHHHHISNAFYHARDNLQPGQGMYNPPQYLDEWKKATVGTLSGALLDLSEEPKEPNTGSQGQKDQAWWETPPSQRRSSLSSRPQKAEAFDGEYDETTNAPTRFKPPLHLKCGPLLRYCGLRQERSASRSASRSAPGSDREIWRGSVMIVTQDADSSYDIAPTLRLFLQPMELLSPPPAEVRGELTPEHVDPLAGHPKLGRKGETLYVRPIENLEEGKDLSRDETDNGLFEKIRSKSEYTGDGTYDPPGSYAARKKRSGVDGEKAKTSKHKDVRGFRLHSERGCTFWRFNIEVELRETQQRIAYRINRGPATGFWVPAKGQAMNIMFHSCNGFSLSVAPDTFSGPDPMWRDVLNTHQSQPFHVMIGGGDQVYNDAVMRQTKIFQEWLMIKNPLHKHNAPFTAEMQDEIEAFYLERYCMWFSQGLFGMANSQIPMVNMYDDHDIIDGFGSYPHHFMNSPVFSGLGNVAFKYYMLFQHQSVPDETEAAEPSWILGLRPGPYITEQSRSLFMHLGAKVALLAVDARTERMRDEVIRDETWKKIMDRCYSEIVKGKTEHLLVLLGVPIAYPRLVWLENILTSRLMDPVKALGKLGLLGNFLNHFDGGVEVLDDLDDHWTAKNHKQERTVVIEDLQDLAADKSCRITILSGDVHLAAVGQFYSNPKLGIAKHRDFRYMPNIISSAIVNTPPPDLMADILNKRNKVHHFDKETDEDMIPMFAHGVEGKPRNNKRLLPHRNWCSIREYVPGATPPPSPGGSQFDNTPLGSPPGSRGFMGRKLSKRQRGPSFRPDVPVDRSRPPLSSENRGFLGFPSGRRASIDGSGRQPNFLARTFSLGGGRRGASADAVDHVDQMQVQEKPRRSFNLFRRKPKRPDDGGINGQWGDDDDDGYYDDPGFDDERDNTPPTPPRAIPGSRRGNLLRGGGGNGGWTQAIGLRGGAGGEFLHEYEEGDDSYFSARAPRNVSTNTKIAPVHTSAGAAPATALVPSGSANVVSTPGSDPDAFRPKPFHRTPTGLSTKQRKNAEAFEVNLEGGLDITLNVEINQKDPGGSTVPYRLLVPRLWYEYEVEDEGDYEGEYAGIAEPSAAGGPVPAGGPLPERRPSGIRRLLSLNRGKSEG